MFENITLDRRTFLRGATAGAAVLGAGAIATQSAQAYTPKTSGERVLATTWQQQINGYYCGPASARIAISARTSSLPSQSTLASQLGTTSSGTNFSAMAPVLSNRVPGAVYRSQWLNAGDTSAAYTTALWDRATKNIDDGFVTVCDWVIYPGGYPKWGGNTSKMWHYVAIDGYDTRYRTLRICDPFAGRVAAVKPRYWVPVQRVTELCAERGYFW